MVAMNPTPARVPVHPGDLLADALERRGTTAYKLSKATGISQITLSQVLHGKRAITAKTALLVARYLGTSPQFWTGLQAEFDLDTARIELGETLDRVEVLPLAAEEDHGCEG